MHLAPFRLGSTTVAWLKASATYLSRWTLFPAPWGATGPERLFFSFLFLFVFWGAWLHLCTDRHDLTSTFANSPETHSIVVQTTETVRTTLRLCGQAVIMYGFTNRNVKQRRRRTVACSAASDRCPGQCREAPCQYEPIKLCQLWSVYRTSSHSHDWSSGCSIRGIRATCHRRDGRRSGRDGRLQGGVHDRCCSSHTSSSSLSCSRDGDWRSAWLGLFGRWRRHQPHVRRRAS